jgi:hypothetical protein
MKLHMKKINIYTNNWSNNVIVSLISLKITINLLQIFEIVLGYKWNNHVDLEITISQEINFF